MNKGRIVIISGPSGSGKTTLCAKVLSSPRFREKLVKSISATTRPIRSNEVNGRDYLFMGKEEFEAHIKALGFLEYENVFGNYYGTPRRNVEDLLAKGQNVLLAIDVKGAKTVEKLCPDALKIFVNAPSMEALKERLSERGSESTKDLAVRLKTAEEEVAQARYYQYIVINDKLESAYQELEDILGRELGV